MSNTHLLKAVAVVATGTLLSACVSVLPETAAPAPRYAISAGTAPSAPIAPVSWSLVVADPTTSQLFNTVKVPVTTAENRFEFLVGAEWADRVPVLFHRALVRTFENTGAVTNVGDFTTVPIGDYTLRTDIRAFHGDLTGTPTASVDIFTRLVDGNGRILKTRMFTARETALGAAPDQLMPAFDRALDRLLGEITVWTFERVSLPLEASEAPIL
ncbi:MAG: ABC-type transport auxiliary lipoprotein family protein [Pseudomonadota bacterium]